MFAIIDNKRSSPSQFGSENNFARFAFAKKSLRNFAFAQYKEMKKKVKFTPKRNITQAFLPCVVQNITPRPNELKSPKDQHSNDKNILFLIFYLSLKAKEIS
ncbi:hypothetical protein Mgra_00006080 [Meloidogyne graminicola]|uniref:Uncharacterized protein n=1 Tax=Meloidogyne graminicola TaxID=189291 RepID=A0A8S9ZM39_9BILA|nr:hypothetical protein Mgra_00006080 [Meloidogyne graminicola]